MLTTEQRMRAVYLWSQGNDTLDIARALGSPTSEGDVYFFIAQHLRVRNERKRA